MQDLLVLYIQPTLGPAHFARIRALDRQPGIRCRGVQLASRERSRDYRPGEEDVDLFETLVVGVYEDQSRLRVIRAGRGLLARSRADAIIVDQPSDPVQSVLAAIARRRGMLAFTRWASTELDFERKAWREYLKGFLYRRFDGYLVTGTPGARISGNIRRAAAAHLRMRQSVGQPLLGDRGARGRYVPRQTTFLFAGRFLWLKNLPRLISAFARLPRGGRDLGPGAGRLRGRGDDAACRGGFGVPGVAFLGHLQIEALARAYSRAGCLVLPSVSENWGLVVNEAMDCGAPVIVSRQCGCFPELLEEGANGFGIDPLDVEQIAQTLSRFASLSAPRNARRWRRRSREIARLHNADAWAVRVADAIRTIRAERRGARSLAGGEVGAS